MPKSARSDGVKEEKQEKERPNKVHDAAALRRKERLQQPPPKQTVRKSVKAKDEKKGLKQSQKNTEASAGQHKQNLALENSDSNDLAS